MSGKKKKLKKLRRKVKDLKARLTSADTVLAAMVKKAPSVSPLAPRGGFPGLPRIGGVRLAAVAAGVRYAGRTDVMLAECAPGTAIAGVFTRSATRSAPVLDCQAKLGAASDKGAAILVVSSDLEEVMTVADRIGVMVSGRLVAIHDAGTIGMDDIVREIGGGTA